MSDKTVFKAEFLFTLEDEDSVNEYAELEVGLDKSLKGLRGLDKARLTAVQATNISVEDVAEKSPYGWNTFDEHGGV